MANIVPMGKTSYEILNRLIAAGYIVDSARYNRALNEVSGNVNIQALIASRVDALVKGMYNVHLELLASGEPVPGCDCKDWFQAGGLADKRPCKHIIALAIELDGQWPTIPGTPIPAPPTTAPLPQPAGAALTFNQRVCQAIGVAVTATADKAAAILAKNKVPFLIGPTDCAKTSAIRLVAVRNGWAFEALDGMSSFADADLVGLRTDHGTYASVIARAFQRARDGEEVLLFLDELTRFNQRALDVLMRLLLPIAPEVARASGIVTDEAIRLVEVPMWGRDWAPVSRCHVVLACNPWGAVLDPALVRRTVPMEVGFDTNVIALFNHPVRGAIELTWKQIAENALSLPYGYSLISEMESANDRSGFPTYLAQLRAVDAPAADGLVVLLAGLGMTI